MAKFLSEIRKRCRENFIVQFLLPHILVVVLMIFVMMIGVDKALYIVRMDTENSYVSMLRHSVRIIDHELYKIERAALQISREENVRNLAAYQETDKNQIDTALKALDHTGKILNFQNSGLLSETYVFFRTKNRILYNGSYYRPEVLETYIKQWGITREEWENTTLNAKKREPYYQVSGKAVEYVLPFSSRLEGDNEGIVVMRLNMNALEEYLKVSEENKKQNGTTIIYDKEGSKLWTYWNENEESEKIYQMSTQDTYYRQGAYGSVKTKSSGTQWEYMMILPEKAVLETLLTLRRVVNILFGIAVVGGVSIAIVASIKKGYPMNQLKKTLVANCNGDGYTESLNETIIKILNTHQELLKEWEREKPIRRNAFIQDLLRGEFQSKEEVVWAAQKAEVSLPKQVGVVAIIEIFSDNDFPEIEIPNIEMAHIILQMLEKELTDRYPGQTIGYKRSYKSAVILWKDLDRETVKKYVEESYRWLLKEYQIESRWGISEAIRDTEFLWKAFEEAKKAVDNSGSGSPIVLYKIEMENTNGFYLPQIAEDKLRMDLLSGNAGEAETIWMILEKENVSRALNRKQFLKFNQQVVDLLSDIETQKNIDVGFQSLNEQVIKEVIDQEQYFLILKQISKGICQQIQKQKQQQRGIIVEHIMKYLQEHYMESSMGLSRAAEEFQISEGYLSYVFKEQSDINFADYLEQIRIKRAQELLKTGNNTVANVAELVGYNSVQVFRRAFKRVTGISPRDMKKSK